MHHARLKQRFYMHTDFTCIRIVPMHGFMKNSDYSCTVTMHVQKIQINSHPTYSVYLSRVYRLRALIPSYKATGAEPGGQWVRSNAAKKVNYVIHLLEFTI